MQRQRSGCGAVEGAVLDGKTKECPSYQDAAGEVIMVNRLKVFAMI